MHASVRGKPLTRRDSNLLQAAGAPAGDAAEGTDEADDLAVVVVLDLHVEAPQ